MKAVSFSTAASPDDERPRDVRSDPAAPDVADVDHEVEKLVDLDDDDDLLTENERLQIYDANYDAYVTAWEDEREHA